MYRLDPFGPIEWLGLSGSMAPLMIEFSGAISIIGWLAPTDQSWISLMRFLLQENDRAQRIQWDVCNFVQEKSSGPLSPWCNRWFQWVTWNDWSQSVNAMVGLNASIQWWCSMNIWSLSLALTEPLAVIKRQSEFGSEWIYWWNDTIASNIILETLKIEIWV